jgi:hypothetical protein
MLVYYSSIHILKHRFITLFSLHGKEDIKFKDAWAIFGQVTGFGITTALVSKLA